MAILILLLCQNFHMLYIYSLTYICMPPFPNPQSIRKLLSLLKASLSMLRQLVHSSMSSKQGKGDRNLDRNCSSFLGSKALSKALCRSYQECSLGPKTIYYKYLLASRCVYNHFLNMLLQARYYIWNNVLAQRVKYFL